MVADDAVKARRRLRYAWVAGFVSAAIGLVNALVFSSGGDAEAPASWSTGQLIFVLTESSLVAALSFGVLKRGRAAAGLLFFYFVISRISLLSLGLIKLQLLPLQALFAYLFFQGLRGALTFHHLTHPAPSVPSASGLEEARTRQRQ